VKNLNPPQADEVLSPEPKLQTLSYGFTLEVSGF
jgi:hypothetical protein